MGALGGQCRGRCHCAREFFPSPSEFYLRRTLHVIFSRPLVIYITLLLVAWPRTLSRGYIFAASRESAAISGFPLRKDYNFAYGNRTLRDLDVCLHSGGVLKINSSFKMHTGFEIRFGVDKFFGKNLLLVVVPDVQILTRNLLFKIVK
jgi:hypothetical protein